MGVISSKNVSHKKNLLKVDSTSSEQFSVWRTTVFGKESFNREGKDGEEFVVSNSHTIQVYLDTPTTDGSGGGTRIKLEFFIRKYEKCVGVDEDDNDATLSKGYSLWMAVKMDNDENHRNYQEKDIIFCVKTRKSVNGQEESGEASLYHRDVIVISSIGQEGKCYPEEFLIDEHFLVLGFQQRNLRDGKVKKNVSLLGDLIKIKVDFAVKMLYASEDERGEMGQVTLKGKGEGSAYLVKDLKKIYTGEVRTDVVLKAADGMVVKAHKVILAARSPYFNRLIQWNPSSFSNKSAVPFSIDNVNGRSLLAVIHWMYTGELMEDVGLDRAVLEEMMKAGRKFEMVDLLKVLEKRGHLNGGSQCSSCCVAKNGGNERSQLMKLGGCKDAVKKIKRAVMAWFPLLRYRFGNRQVGLVASIINAIYGIYELV